MTSTGFISLLFRPYLSHPPRQRIGFKRSWVPSQGLRPGRWEFAEYTLRDAIVEGLFEFDEMGGYWDLRFEEWIPSNPLFADDLWMFGIENSHHQEIQNRDADFLDFKYHVIRSFIPLLLA